MTNQPAINTNKQRINFMKSTHNKSTHNKATQPDVKYPCLMVASDGDIVLFSAEEKGTKVIANGNSDPVCYYCERWDMICFTPLPPNESVTLQND